MSCITDLTNNIVSTCATQGAGGAEVKAWFVERKYLTFTENATLKSLFDNVAVASGKKLLTLTGVARGFDAGHDVEIAEKRANRYIHAFDFEAFEMSPAVREDLDKMDDVVVIYERLDKGTDKDDAFIVLGAKYGLTKTADTRRELNAQGARAISLASRAGVGEPFSSYTLLKDDYVTTAALLVTLETAA